MYCALPDDPKKSSSLQALNENGPPPPAPPSSSAALADASGAPEPKTWSIAERIGGKISIDLANGSSANNSGRGSRSSGMQDVGSEAHSIGGLDTAISHHHNAASLTRFDTENRDFDQRLAQVIYNNDGSFAKGTYKLTILCFISLVFRLLDASRFPESLDTAFQPKGYRERISSTFRRVHGSALFSQVGDRQTPPGINCV